jgi:hypothetical protein
MSSGADLGLARSLFRELCRWRTVELWAAGEAEMKTKLLHESAGQRVYGLVMEIGEEAMSCLQNFAKHERIGAAQITGIGALSSAMLNYFDWEQKKYLPIPVREQVEVHR